MKFPYILDDPSELKEILVDELSAISTIQSHLLKGATLRITSIEMNQLHLDLYGTAEALDIKVGANLSPRGNGPCSAARVRVTGCVYANKETQEIQKLHILEVKVTE